MVLPARAASITRTMCSVGNTTGASISTSLLLRLDQIDRGGGGAMLGMAVHGIDQVLVEKILRGKIEPLGVAAFPGRGPQIAGRDLAFAGIKFGHLAEFQRVTFARIAVEIVQDTPAHGDHLRVATRFGEGEVVDRAMRHERDRAVFRMRPAWARYRRRKHHSAGKNDTAR